MEWGLRSANGLIPPRLRARTAYGGLSTGPRTEAGRRRIAEVQRRRWRQWRASGIRRSERQGQART